MKIFLAYDLTLAEINPLAKLDDGRFIVLDGHIDIEAEARGEHKTLLADLGIGDDETRQARPPTDFELAGARVNAADHRGVAGNVVEFDGNLGLVIGAGGGSLTLFDAVRKHGGKPANYCEIGGNPSMSKAKELTKLILSKPGVEKIAVMMNVVSNTRVDIVARGVIKGCLEAGKDPAETIAIFRIPGAWEEEGFKILEEIRRRLLRSQRLDVRRRRPRRREDAEEEVGRTDMSILLSREHPDHHPGHHRPRSHQPDPREPRLRHEDRRRRDTGPRRPRHLWRTGLRQVREAVSANAEKGIRVTGSIVSVPPNFTQDAIFEALECGIELIVVVTENVPRKQVAQAVELRGAEAARGSSGRTVSASSRPMNARWAASAAQPRIPARPTRRARSA